MHNIDDLKVGTLVKHEKYGEGFVAIDGLSDCKRALVQFESNAWWCEINDLTIIKQPISKMETTEEKTMQEFEPITKDNIEDVLEYNGWKYDGEVYNHYQSTENGFEVDYIISLEDDFKYNLYTFSGNNKIINFNVSPEINDFDEFLAFVQKRVELKPIPKNIYVYPNNQSKE